MFPFKVQILIEDKWETHSWEELNETILFGNDLSTYPKRFWSGMVDKNRTEIYEGDVIKIVNDLDLEVLAVCQFSQHIRHTGINMIQVPGFAFVKEDGFPSFPITENYVGKHDLEMIEIVGNVFDDEKLSNLFNFYK